SREALLAELARRRHRRLEEGARIEFLRLFGHRPAHGAGHGEADVGVDIDLAHAVADAFNDLLDRHAVSFLDPPAVLADHRQPFLRQRRSAVHPQMGVREAGMDGLDAVCRHRQSWKVDIQESETNWTVRLFAQVRLSPLLCYWQPQTKRK